MQTDWLGNELQVGDRVLYSSTSTHTGMNLGDLVTLEPSKIQVKIPRKKWKKIDGQYQSYVGTQTITLQKGTSAFSSITKYFGPDIDLEQLAS